MLIDWSIQGEKKFILHSFDNSSWEGIILYLNDFVEKKILTKQVCLKHNVKVRKVTKVRASSSV